MRTQQILWLGILIQHPTDWHRSRQDEPDNHERHDQGSAAALFALRAVFGLRGPIRRLTRWLARRRAGRWAILHSVLVSVERCPRRVDLLVGWSYRIGWLARLARLVRLARLAW